MHARPTSVTCALQYTYVCVAAHVFYPLQAHVVAPFQASLKLTPGTGEMLKVSSARLIGSECACEALNALR